MQDQPGVNLNDDTSAVREEKNAGRVEMGRRSPFEYQNQLSASPWSLGLGLRGPGILHLILIWSNQYSPSNHSPPGFACFEEGLERDSATSRRVTGIQTDIVGKPQARVLELATSEAAGAAVSPSQDMPAGVE